MPTKAAPHAHKVWVRSTLTGVTVEVAPVDARERVMHPMGGWEYVTTDGARADTQPLAATPPVVSRAPNEILDEKSFAEVQQIAKAAKINAGGTKAEIIDRILPHIANGTVSLDPVKGLPLPLPQGQFPNATPA